MLLPESLVDRLKQEIQAREFVHEENVIRSKRHRHHLHASTRAKHLRRELGLRALFHPDKLDGGVPAGSAVV